MLCLHPCFVRATLLIFFCCASSRRVQWENRQSQGSMSPLLRRATSAYIHTYIHTQKQEKRQELRAPFTAFRILKYMHAHTKNMERDGNSDIFSPCFSRALLNLHRSIKSNHLGKITKAKPNTAEPGDDLFLQPSLPTPPLLEIASGPGESRCQARRAWGRRAQGQGGQLCNRDEHEDGFPFFGLIIDGTQ